MNSSVTVPVAEAAEGTSYWREYYALRTATEDASKIFRGFLIPLDDLKSLLATADITGVRAYLALKNQPTPEEIVEPNDVHIYLVPVRDNVDLCESPTGKSNVCNFTSPCPNVCDLDSPLYSVVNVVE